MGWFDEQIKQRKEKDEEVFEEAFSQLAGSVMGRRIQTAFDDESKVAQDALGEILKFYHIKTSEISAEIKDIDEQMEYLFRPYGIMRRTVRLGERWHKDAVGAMLGTKSLSANNAHTSCGHIFRHTASLFLAGRQPACGKPPCLAKNLSRKPHTHYLRIGS